MICPGCSNNFRLTDSLMSIAILILCGFMALLLWQYNRLQDQAIRDREARQPIMKFLGNTTVHYYDHGEWIITPEKQPSVSEVFKKKK
jgi:hypothetical protein